MRHTALTLIMLTLAACRDEPPAPPLPPAPPNVDATASSAPTPPRGAEVTVTTTSPEARALFDKGRDDADNTREADAIENFKKALARDPRFALAQAYLGYYDPAAEGAKNMEAALAATGLPEAERLTIEELSALRGGDNEKARALAQRIAELAPFDWHVQLDLGNRLFAEHKYEDAKQAFGKAAAFGPAAAVTYNALGYLYLAQRNFEPAIVEFRKYAALRPDEPNTLDSLGEALLAVNKLDEAEQSFRKAAGMKFAFAWGGVAEARFLGGDWTGGMDALGKSREGATLAADKLDVDEMAVWASLAQQKPDEAMKRVDAMEKEAKELKVDDHYASTAAFRAAVLLDSGKVKEAIDELGKATQRLDKAASSGRVMLPVRRLTLTLRALAEARLGRAADAEKTAAEIEALAAKAPAQADYLSMVTFGQGAALEAKGDRKGAVTRLRDCPAEDLLCRRELALLEAQIGDASGAAATVAEVRRINLRDPMYVYVRASIQPKTAGGARE